MSEQTTLHQKKEELFTILLLGYGIHPLLETVSTYLGKAITLCTTNFSIIASTTPVQRTIRFQEEQNHRFLNSQSIDMMQSSHLLEQLQQNWKPIRYSFVDEPDRDYLFAGIHIRQSIIAYLCLDGAKDSIEKKDEFLLEELAKVVSIEMQKDGFFKEKSGSSQEYLLIDLLKGTLKNSDFANHRLMAFDIKLNDYYQIIILSAKNGTKTDSLANYYVTELSRLFPHSLSAYYQGNYVLLLSGTPTELKLAATHKMVQQFIAMHHLYMGISYRFQDLSEIETYYQQALYVLKNSHPTDKKQTFPYHICSFQQLCSLCSDKKVLHAMIHPDIHVLLQQDKNHHTTYIPTLKAYFMAGRNALKAAQRLHIHKSTFFYRLDKIRENTDFALDDEDILFAYELSLHILDYLEG